MGVYKHCNAIDYFNVDYSANNFDLKNARKQ